MEHHKTPSDIIATARSTDANRRQRVLVQLADGAPSIRIEPLCTRPSLCRVIPESAARMHCVVAVSESEGIPTVAVADPHDLDALEWLRRNLGERMRIVVAPESEIRRTIDELYWAVS